MKFLLILLQVAAIMTTGIVIGMTIMMILYKQLLNIDVWKEIKNISGKRYSRH